MSGRGSVLSTQVVIATQRNGTQAVPYGETRDDSLCACCSYNDERYPAALSVSAAPSQLSQRESQGRFFGSTRKHGTVPDKTRNVHYLVIPSLDNRNHFFYNNGIQAMAFSA